MYKKIFSEMSMYKLAKTNFEMIPKYIIPISAVVSRVHAIFNPL